MKSRSGVSAILLAAGESRRMGAFKQLLPFRGKTFVECCVDALLDSRVDEVLVVTGHRHDDVAFTLRQRPVKTVLNPDYKVGMISSVKKGVDAISAQSRAFLIALVDQPQISAALVDRLIDAYESYQPLLVSPTFNGKNGHPLLVDVSLRSEVMSARPEEGLKEVLRAHSESILRIEWETEDVLIDFDLPEEYRGFDGGE